MKNLTIIDQIVEEEIEPALKSITIDHKNLTVVNGFMVTYIRDLLNEKNGLSFPCVAIQPVDDIPTSTPNDKKHALARSIRIVGAVATKDRTTIMRRLNTLIKEVRRVISFDRFDQCHRTKARSFTLNAVTFDIHEI